MIVFDNNENGYLQDYNDNADIPNNNVIFKKKLLFIFVYKVILLIAIPILIIVYTHL